MPDTEAPAVDDHDPSVDYDGRNIILEPLPAGLWLILIGAAVAVLGPAGGFLIGSIIGPGNNDSAVSPVFVALTVGLVIGGIGGLVALLGALRFLRRRARDESRSEPARDPHA